MQTIFLRGFCAAVAAFGLVACGGGGGSGGSNNIAGDGTSPDDPAADFPDSVYANLEDTSAVGEAGMAYVLLDGQILRESDRVSIRYSDGLVSGGLVRGQDISDTGAFTNPANGDFSRVVRISEDNLFGVVGLDVQDGDLPPTGTMTSYNEGWVSLTATFEDEVVVMTGDATFSVNWASATSITGNLANLSGTDSDDGNVSGSINLGTGSVSGDSFTFGNGSAMSGTGVFLDLGRSGTSSSTTGKFFGPDANELGGVLLIDDAADGIEVFGAFQAVSD